MTKPDLPSAIAFDIEISPFAIRHSLFVILSPFVILPMDGRWWIILGAVLAALAVLAGAFGAHGLKQQVKDGRMTAEKLEVFDTAARNQMIHAIGLILVGLAIRGSVPSISTQIAGFAFLFGILLFCGWLYANALSGNVALPLLAPIGGLSFVVGWIALAIAAARWAPAMH
jgi:uncharacterized membrane protein YgdD (TMEM256/DUF423 family)